PPHPRAALPPGSSSRRPRPRCALQLPLFLGSARPPPIRRCPSRRPAYARPVPYETAIAPEMAGGEIFLLQAGTTLALDLGRNRTPPFRPAALSLEQPIIEARITLDVVAHALRRVEVDGLERPHEAPAQRQPLAQRDIHVLAGSISV